MQYFMEQHGMSAEDFYLVHRNMVNHSFPLHLHRAYELICAVNGSITLNVDNKKYVLTKGSLAFIFCNQLHSYFSLGSETFVVLFSPEIIKDFYSAYKEYVPENNIIKVPKGVDFRKLDSIYSKKSVIYALCDDLLNSTKMIPVDSRFRATTHITQKIFAYVEKHFSGDCTLREAANALQYDYTHLSKQFTRFMGTTFTRHLNSYRISRACEMLADNNLTISEIAEQCGYKNLRSFHRNFGKIMNCTPQNYRFSLPPFGVT